MKTSRISGAACQRPAGRRARSRSPISGNTGQTWYLLFKTTGSDGFEGNYGWLSFAGYADGTTNSYITITGWGWDDTGSTIAAGQTAGSTAVPGLGGLAALAIGAGGLRGRRQRATAS